MNLKNLKILGLFKVMLYFPTTNKPSFWHDFLLFSSRLKQIQVQHESEESEDTCDVQIS